MPERFRTVVRNILSRAAPGPFELVRAIRARRLVRRLQDEWGVSRVNREFFARYEPVVRGGPFAGMRFVADGTWSGAVPKILGSYERELEGAFEALLGNDYETVIDVGCADGYYAVGLALRLPRARVYAFDLDPLSRRVCRRVAGMNGVAGRVEVLGRCDPPRLGRLLGSRSLVVSDCEGYEAVLLDPGRVAGLARADIVVELHEDVQPGITQRVAARFAPTHDVQILSPAGRDPSAYPELAFLDPPDRDRALSEYRSEQNWGVFRARRPVV